MIFLLFIGSISTLFAAELIDIHRLDIHNVNARTKALTRQNKSQLTVSQRHAGSLHMEQDLALTPLRSQEDKQGRHYRYQLTYRNIPVYGKTIIVSENHQGNIRVLFGNLVIGLSQELGNQQAKMTPQQAIALAKGYRSIPLSGNTKTENESVQPVVYVDARGHAHWSYVLSYFTETATGQQPAQPVVVIDAMNGQLIDQWDELASLQIGTGPGGNQKTGIYEYGTDMGYINVAKSGDTCIMRNNKVRTLNFNNATSGGIVHSYTCPRNTVKLTNGAYSPLNDAHYFGTAVYDMYNTYLGKPPLPFQAALRVHYGANVSNAYWKHQNKAVILGDGNDKRYPWVSADVMAHELSHGFTKLYSGLIYNNQSGGINEAFSDMAGEALEFYLTGKNDFKFGWEIVKASGAIRNLAYPKLDGKSIAHAAEYVDGMDVHYSSGVFNRAFSLLAKKTNWDTKKAFQLFAYANDRYWASDTTFNQAACGVEQAAIDYGYSVPDVTQAFAAVGVGCGLIWDADTAIGFFGGPSPIFWDSKKTIASGAEPANGMYGLASSTPIYRHNGKRYVEFTFNRQRSSQVFSYSGTICLTLRDRSRGVDEDAGGIGDWAICWVVDADTSPAANGPPWFYTYNDANVVIWGPPLSPGPLDAWRISEGDTIGLAVDLDAGKIWYSRNGVWVGEPSNGSDPAFDQTMYSNTSHFSGKFLSPHLFAHFQEISVKIRGGATETLYPVPAGFSAWGD
jgi:Zn-dependent metalloprotease